MEFRTVASKLPIDEYTLVLNYCNLKGHSISSLIRQLLLEEIEPSVPSYKAGKNVITYDMKRDVFSWAIEFDTADLLNIQQDISPAFLEDLDNAVNNAIINRDEIIGKAESGSIAIPKKFYEEKT